MTRQAVAFLKPAGLTVMQLPSRTAPNVYRTKARDTSPARDENVLQTDGSASQSSSGKPAFRRIIRDGSTRP
jgi:hypothetical protein